VLLSNSTAVANRCSNNQCQSQSFFKIACWSTFFCQGERICLFDFSVKIG